MAEIACLLELELCSPWFDASAPRLSAAAGGTNELARSGAGSGLPPRLLLLLAPPRSGSHHLSRLLWLHGYGRPLEYLNPHLRQALARFQPGWPQSPVGVARLQAALVRRLAPNQHRPLAWWRRLVAERSTLSRRSGRPFFALKLQRGQAGADPASLRRTLARPARHGLWRDFGELPPLLIALFRSDWRRAVLSHHLALASGAFDQGRVVTFQQRPLSTLGDPAALAADLAAYRQQLEWLLACSDQAGFPAWVIEHESLVRDQETVLARLIAQLEGAAARADGPSLALRIARERSDWVAEREAWLDQLQDRFLSAGLERGGDAERAQELVSRLQQRSQASSR